MRKVYFLTYFTLLSNLRITSGLVPSRLSCRDTRVRNDRRARGAGKEEKKKATLPFSLIPIFPRAHLLRASFVNVYEKEMTGNEPEYIKSKTKSKCDFLSLSFHISHFQTSQFSQKNTQLRVTFSLFR